MRKRRLKHTDTAERRRSAALLSGAANGNAHSPARKAQNSYDLAAKMAITPNAPRKSKETNLNHRDKLSQSLPTRERPPQPKCKGAGSKKRSSTCLETQHHTKKTQPKWLWKLPHWRHLNRALRVPSPRPLKPSPRATTALQKRRGEEYIGGSTCSLVRSIRDLQLCTSSSESSPSPPFTPSHSRRATRVYRTRRYMKQLEWYKAVHKERKQIQRLKQQDSKTIPSSADPLVVKGTSGCLGNLGLTHQRENKKRRLPTAQGLPVTKKLPRKTSRRLWRRQLDSSSSDSPTSECSANTTPVCARCMSSSSPGTLTRPAPDTFTSPQAAPSTSIKSARAKALVLSKQYANDNSVSGLKEQKESMSTNSGAFPQIHKTSKSPRTRKTVNFKDSPNPGDLPCASAIHISDKASRSTSAVSPSSQLRLPSTPHVKKKSVRDPKSSALTKQVKTCRYHEVNRKRQSDKSELTPKAPRPLQSASEMIPSPKPIQRETWRLQDPHQRKKGIKRVRQTTSNNSAQTKTRLQAQPQAQFNMASPERSEKPLASKAMLNTFKGPTSASQEDLKTVNPTPGDNCARRMQTPFRKPDTPRPKSCPEFLKWKKVLERRTESTRHAARSVSSCQGLASQRHAELPSTVFGNVAERFSEQSSECSTSIGKFTQKHLPTFKPALSYENSCDEEQSRRGKGNTKRQYSASVSAQSLPHPNSVQAAARKEMELQQLPAPCPSPALKITQEQSSSYPSPELTQAIFGSMRFFWGVQLEEMEQAPINVACHPDTSAFGTDARQPSVSQRTSLSGCQYYVIKPLEPTQPALGQDAAQHIQLVPCRPAQGDRENNTQPLSEQENSGRAAESHSGTASAPDGAHTATTNTTSSFFSFGI